MAKVDSKTKDKTVTEVPQPAPPSQPPAERDTYNWQQFEAELKTRENEIVSMLPPNVDPRKFVASAMAAIKQNPDLLLCTRRSLFTAVTKSAQDGILPDGREGVITSYNTKVSKHGEQDRWMPVAQWNPMAHGLRKRARELDKMLIDAQVVYDGDKFVWHQGDEPKIEHLPAQLGQVRGEGIGAYAIFKREDGTVLHREVMAKAEIETVHNQSKAKTSLMWTTFWTEGWRKTVIRRGIKSVPVSSNFEAIVRREDEHFDFGGAPETPGTIEGTMIPPRPKESDFANKDKPKPKTETPKTSEPDGRPEPPPIGEEVQQTGKLPDPEIPDSLRRQPEPEPEPEPEDDTAPSEAYMAASNLMDALEEKMPNVPDLDVFKKEGRANIEAQPGMTDEERDMLRGRFTTICLAEQKRRAKR